MDLQKELLNHLNKGLEKRPKDLTAIMEASAQKLIDDKVGVDAFKVGDKIPEATLISATNNKVNIYDYLKQGPLIISFYRGAWCPYCNLELRAYKEVLPQIKEAGANFIAISPELPDNSMSLIEKHGLEFDVLSDVNNAFAKKLGLVFRVDDALLAVYEKFGHNWDKAQGNTNKEIPIPATYVIGQDGIILLAFVETDYTKRLSPLVAIKAIETRAY